MTTASFLFSRLCKILSNFQCPVESYWSSYMNFLSLSNQTQFKNASELFQQVLWGKALQSFLLMYQKFTTSSS